MHHIEIYVSNLDKSRTFYSWLLELLGFEIYQNWAQGFSYKKDSFYIAFVQTKIKYIKNGYNRCNIVLNHLAISCESKEKIDEIRKVLIEKEITLLYDERYPNAGGQDS